MSTKTVIWIVAALFFFFVGWLIKDITTMLEVGRFLMSIGFVILGTVIAVVIIKDIHPKS